MKSAGEVSVNSIWSINEARGLAWSGEVIVSRDSGIFKLSRGWRSDEGSHFRGREMQIDAEMRWRVVVCWLLLSVEG